MTGKQILVVDGKIEAIDSSIKRKTDRVIRLEGQHIYPGFIAMGTQLGLVEIDAVRSTRDAVEVGQFNPEVQSWIAVNPDSELLSVSRANGIAYAEISPQGGVVSGTSGLLALEGWTWEEMMVRGPVALHVNWPSYELNYPSQGEAKESIQLKSLEVQGREREARVRKLSDFFDTARSVFEGSGSVPTDPVFLSMGPVFTNEMPVMIHAEDQRQIRAALKWAKEARIKIVICGGRDSWRMAAEIAEQKVPVVFEHVFGLPHRDSDPFDVNFRAPSILNKAGVKVALGFGDEPASSLRNLPYCAAQAVAYGLEPVEALKMLTSNPAEILGLSGKIGTIEKGKQATFFTCEGSPLEIRHSPKRMWIQGKEITLSNRHSRLYERYKTRPKSREPQ